MKKALFLAVIMIALVISACNNKPKANAPADPATATTTTSEKKSDCLNGTWGYTENDTERIFIFNEDKTGKEVYSAEEIRPFTWTYKEGNPAIIYDGETTEWQFVLNCETKELTIMGIAYKKK